MLKFRNPGTNFVLHIQIIKGLFKKFGWENPFSLDDMANVIAVQENLMTAYDYSRESAIELSVRKDKSRDSAYNNAKMYAEHFRILGLITPYYIDKSYPLILTYIGLHMAISDTEQQFALYEQCLWGINSPTELTSNMKYSEHSRFIKCTLRSLMALDGIMYKHELCLGPMSIDDENEEMFSQMINHIKNIRGDDQRLKKEFEKFSKILNMTPISVDNQTRMPLAFLNQFCYTKQIDNTSLYNKKKRCIQLTPKGICTLDKLLSMKDLRLEEFNSYEKSIQESLIRLGIYSMLRRAKFDLSSIRDIIQEDCIKCHTILKGRKLLFSPYQTIKRQLIEEALGIETEGKNFSARPIKNSNNIFNSTRANLIETLQLNIPTTANIKDFDEKEINFLKKIEDLKNNQISLENIVSLLFNEYETSNKDVFYPLVETLFKVIGFNCKAFRTGDNGARWDAIILDEKRSIPIEIKSPTEEMHLSVKAIRQALENKIILLSRKTHITDKCTTSLAIGYCLPNNRAEVSNLISDIKETYGYKIGVLDFKSLLVIAINILVENKGFDKNKLYELEGLASANI